ncbi:hypothetical protein [Qaidamihabitans albus]|uniref:hypothetical protein n=1 Tax=Qaidamihabitans albus TaxID=2795733 RepID=UPI0018F1B935|nr:hypothetical protein [Qaidamihabitans albus]
MTIRRNQVMFQAGIQRPEALLEKIQQAAIRARLPRLLRKPLTAAQMALSLYWQRDYHQVRMHNDHAHYFTLPDGEIVHWPVFWISEVFTPSTLDDLLIGIQKAGWDASRNSVRRENEVRDWVLAARGRPDSSAWMDLVTISRRSSFSYWYQ